MTLEEWRKAQGMTYQQLADKVGAGNATVVRRWCLNEMIPAPEFQMALQIASLGAVGPWSFVSASGVAKKKKGR